MNTTNFYVAAGVIATAIVSWMFSCETLFFLGAVLALALAVVVGTMVGVMTLTERITGEFAREREQWRSVRASSPVSHQ